MYKVRNVHFYTHERYYLTSRKRILQLETLKSSKAIVRCRHYANTSRSRPSYLHAEKLVHRGFATVVRLHYIH